MLLSLVISQLVVPSFLLACQFLHTPSHSPILVRRFWAKSFGNNICFLIRSVDWLNIHSSAKRIFTKEVVLRQDGGNDRCLAKPGSVLMVVNRVGVAAFEAVNVIQVIQFLRVGFQVVRCTGITCGAFCVVLLV